MCSSKRTPAIDVATQIYRDQSLSHLRAVDEEFRQALKIQCDVQNPKIDCQLDVLQSIRYTNKLYEANCVTGFD